MESMKKSYQYLPDLTWNKYWSRPMVTIRPKPHHHLESDV